MGNEMQRWRFSDDRLDNGLRILVMEDHRSLQVNVQVWYHVGSKDEDPERQGFAHMFEHMMFRGTERIGPQDHFKYLQRYGARVNGYTSFDQTVYWNEVPNSQLDLALWLEAERMANLKINEDYFAAEREVVKEERRMRSLNRPYGRLYETLFAAAFKEHPYRWTPIGNMPHLNAATVGELRSFFDRYYVPNNATLVVVGDVRRDEVLTKVSDYFGQIPRGEDPPRVTIVEPAPTEPRRVEIKDRAPSPRVEIAFHGPPAADDASTVLDLLARILSSGQSSRLYRHLVQGKEVAVNAYGYHYGLEQAGLVMFSATLRPGVTIEQGEEALLAEIAALLTDGVSDDELRKAKNQAAAEYVLQGQTVKGRADLLGFAAVILGDPERVNTDLDRIRSVTREEILSVAREVLSKDQRITIAIEPDEATPEVDEVEDKSIGEEQRVAEYPQPEEMPTGRPPQPTDLPFPAIRMLSNGLRIVVFEDHSSPAVTVSFNTLRGAQCDPLDKAGLAKVTISTLRRGTRQHTADALAEVIDAHGMTLSEQVRHDDSRLVLWTLSEYIDLAVATIAEIVREPVFPDAEVSGYVARAAAREAISEENPSVVAWRLFAGELFGDHPKAQPAGGTSSSLKRITREDVLAFHKRFFAPAGATLMLAGDIGTDEAVTLAEKYFATWTGEPEAAQPAALPARQDQQVVLRDREGVIQSEIRVGQLTPLSRRDKDYAAARLLSLIFGELFSARLNESLRIEKGLTYGVRGRFEVDVDAASLDISTFTRTDKTDEAIKAILVEIEGLLVGDVTQEELARARDTLIGGFQLSLETPAQIASRWWDLTVWDLPERWYSDYLRDVAGVESPAALANVARRLIDPSKLTIVVVGDADALEEPLNEIAPVRRQ